MCSQTTIESYQVKFNALPLRAPFVEPSLYTTSPWDGLLAANKPGLVPSAPIYLAQGFDELVPADATVAFARAECNLGAYISNRRSPDVGHNPADVRSAADAIAWISDRFAGKSAPDSCPSIHPKARRVSPPVAGLLPVAR